MKCALMRRFVIERAVKDPRTNDAELRVSDLLRRRVILWREKVGLAFAEYQAGEYLYDPMEEPEDIEPIGLKLNRTRAMLQRCFLLDRDY